jgi:hypothetical protein
MNIYPVQTVFFQKPTDRSLDLFDLRHCLGNVPTDQIEIRCQVAVTQQPGNDSAKGIHLLPFRPFQHNKHILKWWYSHIHNPKPHKRFASSPGA